MSSLEPSVPFVSSLFRMSTTIFLVCSRMMRLDWGSLSLASLRSISSTRVLWTRAFRSLQESGASGPAPAAADGPAPAAGFGLAIFSRDLRTFLPVIVRTMPTIPLAKAPPLATRTAGFLADRAWTQDWSSLGTAAKTGLPMIWVAAAGVMGCPFTVWFRTRWMVSLGNIMVVSSERIRLVWLMARMSGVVTRRISVECSRALSASGVSSLPASTTVTGRMLGMALRGLPSPSGSMPAHRTGSVGMAMRETPAGWAAAKAGMVLGSRAPGCSERSFTVRLGWIPVMTDWSPQARWSKSIRRTFALFSLA